MKTVGAPKSPAILTTAYLIRTIMAVIFPIASLKQGNAPAITAGKRAWVAWGYVWKKIQVKHHQ